MAENDPRKDSRLTRVESVEGKRFAVNLGYAADDFVTLSHPAYAEVNPETLNLRRVVPHQQRGFVDAPVVAHKVMSLEVKDKSGNKNVDVLKLLPSGWQLLVVEFPKAFLDIMKRSGQDMEAPDQRENLLKRLPLMTFGDRKVVSLPVYRLRETEYLDETAEQLIYNIGVSRGIAEHRATNNDDAFRIGRQFLRDTFGGPLLMDRT